MLDRQAHQCACDFEGDDVDGEAGDEHKKRAIVFMPDAVVEPDAVVVEGKYASVAAPTMFALLRA